MQVNGERAQIQIAIAFNQKLPANVAAWYRYQAQVVDVGIRDFDRLRRSGGFARCGHQPGGVASGSHALNFEISVLVDFGRVEHHIETFGTQHDHCLGFRTVRTGSKVHNCAAHVVSRGRSQ